MPIPAIGAASCRAVLAGTAALQRGQRFAARRGRDRDREPPRQRRRSPSDDFSSGSPEPRERLRPTWFDVTPEMVAQGQGGRSEEEVKDLILKKAGEQMPVDKSGLQLTQATRHARRIYVGGLPPSANEDRISSFFSYALAAVGGALLWPTPLRNAQSRLDMQDCML